MYETNELLIVLFVIIVLIDLLVASFCYWLINRWNLIEYSFINNHSKKFNDKYLIKITSMHLMQKISLFISYSLIGLMWPNVLFNLSIFESELIKTDKTLLTTFYWLSYLVFAIFLILLIVYVCVNKPKVVNNYKKEFDYLIANKVSINDFGLPIKLANKLNKKLNHLIVSKEGFSWDNKFYSLNLFINQTIAKHLVHNNIIKEIDGKNVPLDLNMLNVHIESKLLESNKI